jgi:hypothetical protein
VTHHLEQKYYSTQLYTTAGAEGSCTKPPGGEGCCDTPVGTAGKKWSDDTTVFGDTTAGTEGSCGTPTVFGDTLAGAEGSCTKPAGTYGAPKSIVNSSNR